jgi:uncharacterized membrane protein
MWMPVFSPLEIGALFVSVVVMVVVIMIMRMRVRDHAMCMLVAMGRAGRDRRLMRMIVVRVVVGMLMRMGDGIVGVRVRIFVHGNLLFPLLRRS